MLEGRNESPAALIILVHCPICYIFEVYLGGGAIVGRNVGYYFGWSS